MNFNVFEICLQVIKFSVSKYIRFRFKSFDRRKLYLTDTIELPENVINIENISDDI